MSADTELVEVDVPQPPESEGAHIPDPNENDPPIGKPSALSKGLLRPRTLLSFAFALAILVYFIQRMDLDLGAVVDNIRTANLLVLGAAIAVYVATIVLRAARWRWMLAVAGAGNIPGTTVPPVGYLTAVLLVSWFFNCILPAKLGDAYRIYRVKVDDGIRYSIGFGTVLTERVIDLIVLVLMLAVSAAVAFHGDLPSDARNALYVGIGLSVLALVGLIVLFVLRNHIEAKLPIRWRNQWQTLQESVFVNLGRPAVPAVMSVVIWGLEASRVYLVAKSLNVHLGFEMAIFVGLMAALLTTLPFTPAGLGVVEVAVVSVLKLADVPVDLAGSVALLDRLITYWGLIAVGATVYLYMLKWGIHQRSKPADD
ncbi:MAG TPA: lysylphosphatidylglycerol synthase transmembrane domain-containing protein [Thermomicrobiales bacterium]|nr:lysylphosphatidylglycerol synthase transmembrane domain-containing protein [Thermomicrobiales bacterium]